METRWNASLPGSWSPCALERELSAFTLIELLVVIGIMALVAAIAAPSLKQMKKSDVMAAATRQLLDDLAWARQRAMADRSTVYLVFMPPATPNLQNIYATLSLADRNKMLAYQLTSYAMYSDRTAGDQPGQPYGRYLKDWHSLPDSIFIPLWKFTGPSADPTNVLVFQSTSSIPIPSTSGPTGPGVIVPYVAFDYQGRLVTPAKDEVIPLARGPVSLPSTWAVANTQEDPPANSYDPYLRNYVRIDWLTGRAKWERPEIAP